MSIRIRCLVALVIAGLVLAACEQPVQKPGQGDMVVRDWIAAAVNKDGQTYCGLMTPRLLAVTTGQPGKTAKKTCAREIKAGTGDYPFQFEVDRPSVTQAGAAQVDATGKKLRGHITLKQHNGKLLIDSVQ
ncbi:MAG: nuclear transport factor 2 family protein [Actinobacteria bacterium]|nr:nuclear transport factor 2 family protein [Actinomycetota bacterium]